MASDFARVASKLRDLEDDLRDEHEDATKRGTRRLRRETRRQITAPTPNPGAGAPARESVARNKLHRDTREGKQADGTADIAARQVHMPEWAKYVDKGTGPLGDGPYEDTGFPPVEKIRKWAITKPIQLEYADDYQEAAWLIAQTIAQLGTFPHPFIDKAWHGPRGYQNIVEENHAAMKRVLRRF